MPHHLCVTAWCCMRAPCAHDSFTGSLRTHTAIQGVYIGITTHTINATQGPQHYILSLTNEENARNMRASCAHFLRSSSLRGCKYHPQTRQMHCTYTPQHPVSTQVPIGDHHGLPDPFCPCRVRARRTENARNVRALSSQQTDTTSYYPGIWCYETL